MKNVNYNLLKVLHGKLDNAWRIEKHYLGDAKKGCKNCLALLKKIAVEDNKEIDLLRKELAAHIKSNKLS